jgi:hypothetical protein
MLASCSIPHTHPPNPDRVWFRGIRKKQVEFKSWKTLYLKKK